MSGTLIGLEVGEVLEFETRQELQEFVQAFHGQDGFRVQTTGGLHLIVETVPVESEPAAPIVPLPAPEPVIEPEPEPIPAPEPVIEPAPVDETPAAKPRSRSKAQEA